MSSAAPELSVEAVVQGIRGRDRNTIACVLDWVEERLPASQSRVAAILGALPARRLRCEGSVVGVTGAPGVGKSSLVSRLITAWRAAGSTVGVLAVDPSSPVSGGALLGDRVRMLRPASDDGVFIRSLAGRGELGGLSADLFPMRQVLLSAFDGVVVETIGVGQSEQLDVVGQTDTTCLVVQPGCGDTLQFLKAGLLELPAVVAVNKADLGRAAAEVAREIAAVLAGRGPQPREAVVLEVSAKSGQGVEDLVHAFEQHRIWLEESGQLPGRRSQQEGAWIVKRLGVELGRFAIDQLGGEAALRARCASAGGSPFEQLEQLRRQLLRRWQD